MAGFDDGMRVGGACGKGCRWLLEVSDSHPAANKETGASVLQKCGTEFYQCLNKLGNGFISRTSRKKCSLANMLISALCDSKQRIS